MSNNKNIDYTSKSEIKIFLASSINEFENERNKIGDLVRKMQNDLLEKGIRINLFECEFEDNSMVKGRKQEQYNQKLRESDIMILLIGNRVGEFTDEEYEVSKEAKEIKRFIFFKNCEVDDSVIKFREKLGTDVYESGLENKIKEYDEEERLYEEVKKIIIDSITKINTNNLEKEELKIYNFIFLEGNKDLENDKYAISNFIRNINDKYKRHRVYFNFITNEDIGSLTEKDMQDCSGFFIIVGKDIDEKIYEDFDNAYKYFIENESPDLRPFVRKDIKERTQRANEFIRHVGDNLQHYYGEYIDIYRIKYEINNKIDDMKTSNASIEIIDGCICIDGEEFIPLDKMPMFSNNEQLIELKEKFEKIESEYLELKSSDMTKEENKLEEITEKYYKYKREIQDLENQIFNFSKKFSKDAGKNKLTKKQIAAYKCLERGDLESAKEILNIEDINNDIEHIEAEQESRRNKLAGFVQELISRAETYDLDIKNPERVKEIYASYERAVKVEEDNHLPHNACLMFVEFCNKQEDYEKSAELIEKYINWAYYTNNLVALELHFKLIKAYGLSGNFEKAYENIESLYQMCQKAVDEGKDETITKCRIDLAKADTLIIEGQYFFENAKIREYKKNTNKAIILYVQIAKTLVNKYYDNEDDFIVYLIIRCLYGLYKFYTDIGVFNKTVDNYFASIKSWLNVLKSPKEYEDLQEIKVDVFYQYANYQFDKIHFVENDYSEIVEIYKEIIEFVKDNLLKKPKLYNEIMFESFNKLEKIYMFYGLYDNLISLYESKIEIIKNKIVILPDDINSIKELEERLVSKKNEFLELDIEQEKQYSEITKEMETNYFELAEKSLKEHNIKKAINLYNDAVLYTKKIFLNKEDRIHGIAIRDYFLNNIYSKLAELYSKNNKHKDVIKNYKKCLDYQAIFKKIGFNKYNLGDYELYEYKILQEMIKANQIQDAIELRNKALRNIGIGISKNLASDELIRIAKDFIDEKISNALKIKKQYLNEFVPNNKCNIGEIQAKFLDSNDDSLVGYAVNLYDAEENKLGQSFVGADAKISYYKVPVGMYRIALVDKYNDDEELMSKYLYVNGCPEITKFNLIYNRAQLTITLVDDANNPINGVTFYIYDEEGHYLTEVVTNEYGKAYVKLADGKCTYLFKQINVNGSYIIDDTLYRFSIDNENKTFSTVITNERFKGRFAIQIKDKNSMPVDGLKIRIYNSDKDEIITITTNKRGQAGARNLPVGKYYYKFIDKDEMNEFNIKEKDEIVIKDVIK